VEAAKSISAKKEGSLAISDTATRRFIVIIVNAEKVKRKI
jgi:hypothetical protein